VAEAARLVRRTAGDRIAGRRMPYATLTPVRSVDPVVLVPGFMAGDSSLLLMSRYLRKLGYRTYRSTMHANVGCTQAASYALERRIEAIAIKRDRKVTVVGHSLGGLLARTIAGRRPDLVEAIVTMGSPILAPGAIHSVLAFDLALVEALRRAGLGTMMGEDCLRRLPAQPGQARVGPLVGGVHVDLLAPRRRDRLARLSRPGGEDRGGAHQPPRHGRRPGGVRRGRRDPAGEPRAAGRPGGHPGQVVGSSCRVGGLAPPAGRPAAHCRPVQQDPVGPRRGRRRCRAVVRQVPVAQDRERGGHERVAGADGVRRPPSGRGRR
jgi:pimeloyl-ACP methyl ester carboxylesterase